MKKRFGIIHTLFTCLLTAGGMYAFNKFYSMYAVRNRKLPSRPENYFSWRGLKIFYSMKGSGTPVVLLHAIHPASSSYEWNEIEDKLAQNHTVYALDLPGCGRSEKPRLHYTNFFYVSLLRDFLHTMSIKNSILVASNLTSAVGVMAEAYDPGLFSKMILINPPAASSLSEVPDQFSKTLMFILNLPLLGSFIYNILSSKPQIDLAFTEKYFYNPFHDNEDLVDIYFESAQSGYGNGHYLYGSIVGKYLNINVNYAVKNLSLPVKILEGESTENAEQAILEWTSLNKSIEAVTITHTRQLPHLEEPERVLEEINSFIKK